MRISKKMYWMFAAVCLITAAAIQSVDAGCVTYQPTYWDWVFQNDPFVDCSYETVVSYVGKGPGHASSTCDNATDGMHRVYMRFDAHGGDLLTFRCEAAGLGDNKMLAYLMDDVFSPNGTGWATQQETCNEADQWCGDSLALGPIGLSYDPAGLYAGWNITEADGYEGDSIISFILTINETGGGAPQYNIGAATSDCELIVCGNFSSDALTIWTYVNFIPASGVKYTVTDQDSGISQTQVSAVGINIFNLANGHTYEIVGQYGDQIQDRFITMDGDEEQVFQWFTPSHNLTTMYGYVYRDGVGVSNATVRLEGDAYDYQIRTDANGFYNVTVRTGVYNAYAWEGLDRMDFYGIWCGEDTQEGGVRQDFVLVPMIRTNLTVYVKEDTAAQNPIEGIAVVLMECPNAPDQTDILNYYEGGGQCNPITSGITDASGYKFFDLSRGIAQNILLETDFTPTSGFNKYIPKTMAKHMSEGHNTQTILLELYTNRTISVNVTDCDTKAPIGSARVQFRYPIQNTGGSTQLDTIYTNALGEANLTDKIDVGHYYKIEVDKSGSHLGDSLEDRFLYGQTLAQHTICMDPVTSGLTTYNISGYVTDTAGTSPLQGIWLRLSYLLAGAQKEDSEKTDSNGYYEFVNQRPNLDYILKTDSPIHLDNDTSFVLSANREINFSIGIRTDRYKIYGRIVDHKSREVIEGASITFTRNNKTHTYYSDKDGLFELNSFSNGEEVELTFTKLNYNDKILTVTIQNGNKNLGDVGLIHISDRYFLRGRVYRIDDEGELYPQTAIIFIFDSGGNLVHTLGTEAYNGEAGFFSIRLPGGSYRVQAVIGKSKSDIVGVDLDHDFVEGEVPLMVSTLADDVMDQFNSALFAILPLLGVIPLIVLLLFLRAITVLVGGK